MPAQQPTRHALHKYLIVCTLVVTSIAIAGAIAASVGAKYLLPQAAVAQTGINSEDTNPRANYWRAVRDGGKGYTAIQGPETGVLIQNGGQNWRQIRNGPLVTYGALALAFVLGAIALFYFVRGRIVLKDGRSGVAVPRWSLNDRVVHWFTAIMFIFLALTGLILLYGRALLIPLFGLETFATVAAAAKDAHNLFGPVFIVSLILLIAKFIRSNLFEKGDLAWLRRGGGLFKQHASAGRFNTGEKLWFWLVAIGGITISVTGLILDFPQFEQTRSVMQWSQIIHAVAALVLVSVALGHIYIGTLGMEGAIEAMTQGHVDENWVKEHHDRWYQEIKHAGAAVTEPMPRGKRT